MGLLINGLPVMMARCAERNQIERDGTKGQSVVQAILHIDNKTALDFSLGIETHTESVIPPTQELAVSNGGNSSTRALGFFNRLAATPKRQLTAVDFSLRVRPVDSMDTQTLMQGFYAQPSPSGFLTENSDQVAALNGNNVGPVARLR